MDQRRILLVLRHAETEDVRPGSRDSQRRLTPDGERHAEEVGDYLRGNKASRSMPCCARTPPAQSRRSSCWRLSDQLAPDRVEIAERFYNAGADTLINAVRDIAADCHVALLVGHAPGAPGLVHEMADSTSSTPEAIVAIESRFPAAALAWLEFDGDWSEADSGALLAVRMPS